MRRLVVILLSINLLLSSVLPVGIVYGADKKEQALPPTLNVREVVKYNEHLATENGIPPVDPEVQKQINEWIKQLSLEREKLLQPNNIGTTQTQIPIGTDYTFLYATEGGNWHSAWLLATAYTSYVLSQRRNNVFGQAWGVGAASGLAWTGHRFTVTGSGTRLAYIDFTGWAAADLLGSFTGTASWEVSARVYDVTAGSWIGETTIFKAQSTANKYIIDGGNFTRSILVSLKASHTYVVQLITFGDVSEYGIFTSLMNSAKESRHTHWDKIRLRWQ